MTKSEIDVQSPEVWIGYVEVRQLPGSNHKIELSGKGAFTWVTCWAVNKSSYLTRITEVMKYYGLFIVDAKKTMPFAVAEDSGIVDDELMEQFADTVKDRKYCIYGTFYSYQTDN